MAPIADDAVVAAMCTRIAQEARGGMLSIVGPGTTMLALKRAMGIDGTLLGVDLILDGKAIALDCDEATILRHMAGRPARIIVGIVGGQGFLFGRGNQQIGPQVIRGVGRDGITIISSARKLASLPAARLLNDSGDEYLDRALVGFVPVRIGPHQTAIVRVESA